MEPNLKPEHCGIVGSVVPAPREEFHFCLCGHKTQFLPQVTSGIVLQIKRPTGIKDVNSISASALMKETQTINDEAKTHLGDK